MMWRPIQVEHRIAPVQKQVIYPGKRQISQDILKYMRLEERMLREVMEILREWLEV